MAQPLSTKGWAIFLCDMFFDAHALVEVADLGAGLGEAVCSVVLGNNHAHPRPDDLLGLVIGQGSGFRRSSPRYPNWFWSQTQKLPSDLTI